MALVKFIRGAKPQDLSGLNADTLYFFTDAHEIYLGGQRYAGDPTDLVADVAALETWQTVINNWKNGSGETAGAEARITALEADTHTHSNKSVLDGITAAKVTAWDAAESNATAVANQKVASVTAADNSITVGGTSTAPTVGVKLNAASDNALSLTDTGLKVTIPAQTDYSVTLTSLGSNADYANRYELKQGPAGSETSIGTINIPKDMVVDSGSVVTLSAPDSAGHAAGTYIKILLQNTDDELWIPVDSLIEYVTSGSAAGDMVVVNIDGQHRVTATITDGTVTKAKLASGVQASLDLADSAMQSIGAGTVTKAMLESSVQSSLDSADSALQESDISAGVANGSITVGSKSVSVTGLGTAAYQASTAFATAAQGATADTALQPADITTGGANGTISVDGTDVAVKGLGTAAYTAATAYATAAQGTKADDVYAALTWGSLA